MKPAGVLRSYLLNTWLSKQGLGFALSFCPSFQNNLRITKNPCIQNVKISKTFLKHIYKNKNENTLGVVADNE